MESLLYNFHTTSPLGMGILDNVCYVKGNGNDYTCVCMQGHIGIYRKPFTWIFDVATYFA